MPERMNLVVCIQEGMFSLASSFFLTNNSRAVQYPQSVPASWNHGNIIFASLRILSLKGIPRIATLVQRG